MTEKKWHVLNQTEIKQASVDEVVRLLLESRGFKTHQEIDAFLNPKLEDVTARSISLNPTHLKKAIARIKKAITKNEKIIVYGDYDVDGICGSAILWETLFNHTKKVAPYIPHRVDEGYGLSTVGLENLLEEHPDTKLIITVDNGIVAYKAVEVAHEKGIDVVITDHHVPGKDLPKAHAVVHTTIVCGAGVAYFLAKELKKSLKFTPKNDEHLELVALATIADLVPLHGPNRTLVKFGLEHLHSTRRPGIVSICREAKIEQAQIGVYEIGHIIGPRLNASGRILHALDSLRLLCTKDNKRALDLALQLGKINKERQLLTEEASNHARLFLQKETFSRIMFAYDKEHA